MQFIKVSKKKNAHSVTHGEHSVHSSIQLHEAAVRQAVAQVFSVKWAVMVFSQFPIRGSV